MSCDDQCEKVLKQINPQVSSEYIQSFCKQRYVNPDMGCILACASKKCTKACLTAEEKKQCLNDCEKACKETDEWWTSGMWMGIIVTILVILLVWGVYGMYSRQQSVVVY